MHGWRWGTAFDTITLKGEWGGRTRTMMQLRYSRDLSGSVHQDYVVYAGIRQDGMLLVSMEALPRNGAPGMVKRAVLRWDRAANAPRSQGVWEGPIRQAPSVFRIRPPRGW